MSPRKRSSGCGCLTDGASALSWYAGRLIKAGWFWTWWIDDLVAYQNKRVSEKEEPLPVNAQQLAHDLGFVAFVTTLGFGLCGTILEFFTYLSMFMSPVAVAISISGDLGAQTNQALAYTLIIFVVGQGKSMVLGGNDPNFMMLIMQPFWALIRAPWYWKFQFFYTAVITSTLLGGTMILGVYLAGKMAIWVYGSTFINIPPLSGEFSTQNFCTVYGIYMALFTGIVWCVRLGIAERDGAMLSWTSAERTKWRVNATVAIYNGMNSIGYLFFFYVLGVSFIPDPLYLLATWVSSPVANSYGIFFAVIIGVMAVTVAVMMIFAPLLLNDMWLPTRWWKGGKSKKWTRSGRRSARNSSIETTRNSDAPDEDGGDSDDGDDDEEDEEA